MYGINEIVNGMTPQEKDIYFEAMHRNAVHEAQVLEAERNRNRIYRRNMIEDILKRGKGWTEKQLKDKSTKTLERIYDFG